MTDGGAGTAARPEGARAGGGTAPSPGAGGSRSYYGRPVLQPPVWEDDIGWYLFTGGLAGASLPLAAGARVAGNDRLARRALLCAGAALGVSVPLLVRDLGRPARFHHMLRVLKPSSPMSVGTWLLTASGLAAGAATATDVVPDLPLGRGSRLAASARPAGRVAEAVAAVSGLGVATYTAVLVGQTAVPLWHEGATLLPPLFAASAGASAGAAASVVTPSRDAMPARLLCVAGATAEVAAARLHQRRLGALGEPLSRGTAGRLARAAQALGLGGAVVVAAAGRRRRPLAVAGGLAVLAGSACERLAILHAGRESATDPRYTVAPQRERLEAAGGRPSAPRR